MGTGLADGLTLLASFAAGSVFYVPQKPYTTVGSFRDQLIYPLPLDQALAREEGQTEAEKRLALDARLERLLADVKLSYLKEQRYKWEDDIEWSETLSLGASSSFSSRGEDAVVAAPD